MSKSTEFDNGAADQSFGMGGRTPFDKNKNNGDFSKKPKNFTKNRPARAEMSKSTQFDNGAADQSFGMGES